MVYIQGAYIEVMAPTSHVFVCQRRRTRRSRKNSNGVVFQGMVVGMPVVDGDRQACVHCVLVKMMGRSARQQIEETVHWYRSPVNVSSSSDH